jgi:hypothetical protein
MLRVSLSLVQCLNEIATDPSRDRERADRFGRRMTAPLRSRLAPNTSHFLRDTTQETAVAVRERRDSSRRYFDAARPGHACASAGGPGFRRVLGVAALTWALLGGCPQASNSTADRSFIFNNRTDPTNGNASYIGSAACQACHPDLYEMTRLHGHAHALSRAEGAPPEFPSEAARAGVPDPPAGRTWNDVSFAIGGYTHGAFFVDRDGFVMTDGTASVNTQWNLAFPPNGSRAEFVAYLPGQSGRLPYDYDCFRCHTVGPLPQDPHHPRSQDGRPGIRGTWAEEGVRCEACHGPGSHHAPNPQARANYVDESINACRACHTGDPTDPTRIPAADGFLNPNSQWSELRASGGHSGFTCLVCHDPHASTSYDHPRGIRNRCVACHAEMNLAFHEGKVYRRGEYVELLTCESCHMPFAGRSNSLAGPEVLDAEGGRMGDVRAHIFRIDTEKVSYAQMLSTDGSRVLLDAAGRAAVTPDFACVRCHNGVGSAFHISPPGAAEIGRQMHQHAANARLDPPIPQQEP